MNACADAGSKVISMSLGGPVATFAERVTVDALKSQGILLVAASGNDGNGANAVEYPSGYDNVMCVSAVGSSTNIATFSTYNSDVDISAPGVGILSLTSSGGTDGSYSQFDGTSMATPHVAAAGALLMARFSTASVDAIRNALERSATDFGACGKDRLYGHGMLNVLAAGDYLSNAAGDAPEIGGCIDVQVRVKTDRYGGETSYVITPSSTTESFKYRGGPYPNNRLSTYTDNFQLADGCYTIYLLDSYGDG